MSRKEPLRAPVGRVQTGMASYCKTLPAVEQLEQQQLREGRKFKQRGVRRRGVWKGEVRRREVRRREVRRGGQ